MIDFIDGGSLTSPLGYRASAAVADIKGKGSGRLDLALLMSDEPANTVALFTKNIVKAAPVLYDMQVLSKSNKISAVIANAGNANACTGDAGLNDCKEIISQLNKKLKLKENAALISSTGVIGQRLKTDKIFNVLDELVNDLSDDGGADFATAIMTTDTFKKEVAVLVTDNENNVYCIAGCTKGAGMIAPSLATMLTYITTDANIDINDLNKAVRKATENSFDSITVDGDMSTNDTVIVMANAMSGVKITDKNYTEFISALEIVFKKLALMIIKDAEGGTKLVTINIKGARDDIDAKNCVYKIANSPLVKTMFAGSDPNWGRLLASAGASGAIFDPNDVDIYFNDLHYVSKSAIIDESLEKNAYEIMKKDEFSITINLNAGSAEKTYYTSDFTADYVKINADYRS